MHITVYAIAKNESKFVDRWVDSMQEADTITVLDTGSTDDTIDRLRARGVKVSRKKIDPWRFDVARNDSLKRVPKCTDVCVCTDLDEVLLPGWRKALETAWERAKTAGVEPTTGTYEYVWNFNRDGSDGVKFTYEKVHAYGVAKWVHPVHEVLEYSKPKVRVDIPGMRLEHHADQNKSRAQYLPLLELAVRENPEDDRDAHYYGRELMFHGKWREAIEQLKRHLALPRATWKPERAASMRFIARCERSLNNLESAKEWLRKAVVEAPEKREAAVELAEIGYQTGDWEVCVEGASKAVSIENRDLSYLTEPRAWSELPWDLLSIGLWNMNRRKDALDAALEAHRLAPEDSRIANNVNLMMDAVKRDREHGLSR